MKNNLLTEKQLEKNRDKFFELYKKVQAGECDLYSLDKNTLKMIYKMMQEELKILDKAILKKKSDICNLKNKKNY